MELLMEVTCGAPSLLRTRARLPLGGTMELLMEVTCGAGTALDGYHVPRYLTTTAAERQGLWFPTE